MKLPDDISAELEALISAHYYSEDVELLASFRAYAGALQNQEMSYLKQVALARLADEGTIAEILLCAAIDIPSAVPILIEKLNSETAANQTSRALMLALSRYDSSEGYSAVERYLDSDQETEALESLARIDFVQTLPNMVRRLHDEGYSNVLLQILYNRSMDVGVEVMISNLMGYSGRNVPDLRESMIGLLYSKKEPDNPFSPNEIRRIIHALGERGS